MKSYKRVLTRAIYYSSTYGDREYIDVRIYKGDRRTKVNLLEALNVYIDVDKCNLMNFNCYATVSIADVYIHDDGDIEVSEHEVLNSMDNIHQLVEQKTMGNIYEIDVMSKRRKK